MLGVEQWAELRQEHVVREQVPAEPSKADQDATFTSLSWMIGASLA